MKVIYRLILRIFHKTAGLLMLRLSGFDAKMMLLNHLLVIFNLQIYSVVYLLWSFKNYMCGLQEWNGALCHANKQMILKSWILASHFTESLSEPLSNSILGKIKHKRSQPNTSNIPVMQLDESRSFLLLSEKLSMLIKLIIACCVVLW